MNMDMRCLCTYRCWRLNYQGLGSVLSLRDGDLSKEQLSRELACWLAALPKVGCENQRNVMFGV